MSQNLISKRDTRVTFVLIALHYKTVFKSDYPLTCPFCRPSAKAISASLSGCLTRTAWSPKSGLGRGGGIAIARDMCFFFLHTIVRQIIISRPSTPAPVATDIKMALVSLASLTGTKTEKYIMS